MNGRRAALTTVVVAGLGAGVGLAHASAMAVTGSTLQARTMAACSPAALTVSETPGGLAGLIFGNTGVALVVPAGCSGADLKLTIYTTSTGATQATALATAVPAGPASLATSATYGGLFRPAYSVAVTMDGWTVPATF